MTKVNRKKSDQSRTPTQGRRNKLGQFTKASPWTNIAFIKIVKQMPLKLLAFTLIVGLNGVALSQIGYTMGYYNDIESSEGNSFSATMLDFILTNNNLEKVIGPEALGEISHASVAMPEDDSLPMQYDVSTSVDITSNTAFCAGLIVEAKLNGITKYNNSLSGLTYATTTEFGTWEFRFDLPPNVSIPHGAQCAVSVLFSAWRADIANKIDSSWHDEETLNISFTARMVVLNEIFARPNGGVAPQDREYIELYNNGSTSVDTLGWQISEIAGTTEIFYPIVTSGAISGQVQPSNGASTIIPAGGFLVLEFGGSASHLNNDGDTVKLYDNAITDSHTYPSITAGKAVVRFPDGIGFWVDPEPTPGEPNRVSMQDLIDAGLDEETIQLILALLSEKGETLLSEEPIEEVIENPASPDASQGGPIEEIINTEIINEEIVEDPVDEIIDTEIIEEPIDEVAEESQPETPEAILPEESIIIEESQEVNSEEIIEGVIEEPASPDAIQSESVEEITDTEVVEEVVVEESVIEETVIEEPEAIIEPQPEVEAPTEEPVPEPEPMPVEATP